MLDKTIRNNNVRIDFCSVFSTKRHFTADVAKIMIRFSKISPRHCNHFAEKDTPPLPSPGPGGGHLSVGNG
jgi:hypothetical protein